MAIWWLVERGSWLFVVRVGVGRVGTRVGTRVGIQVARAEEGWCDGVLHFLIFLRAAPCKGGSLSACGERLGG